MRAEGMTVIPLPVVSPDSDRIIKSKAAQVQAIVPIEGGQAKTENPPDDPQARLGNILERAEERKRFNDRRRARLLLTYTRHKSQTAPEQEKGRKLNKAV